MQLESTFVIITTFVIGWENTQSNFSLSLALSVTSVAVRRTINNPLWVPYAERSEIITNTAFPSLMVCFFVLSLSLLLSCYSNSNHLTERGKRRRAKWLRAGERIATESPRDHGKAPSSSSWVQNKLSNKDMYQNTTRERKREREVLSTGLPRVSLCIPMQSKKWFFFFSLSLLLSLILIAANWAFIRGEWGFEHTQRMCSVSVFAA